MNRKKNGWARTAGIVCLLVAVPLGFLRPVRAQAPSAALRQDLDIMETILEKLLEDGGLIWRGQNSVHGVYLKDFGLLFTVNLEGSRLQQLLLTRKMQRLSEENLRRLKKLAPAMSKIQEAKLRAMMEKNIRQLEVQLETAREGERKKRENAAGLSVSVSSGEEPGGKEIQKWLSVLDRKIRTFLGTYVDRGNRIGAGEQVMVVAFLGKSDMSAGVRLYRVSKRAILLLRREKISEPMFEKNVQITDADSEHAEEIDILAHVIRTSLRKSPRFRTVVPASAYGTYLNGLGVLFQLSNLHSFLLPLGRIEEGENSRAVILTVKEAETDSAALRRKEAVRWLTDRLVRILGTYGPTLRFLPKDQSLFVLFGVGGGWMQEGRTNVLLRLKKKDVLAYSAGKISLVELKKRVQVAEF